MQLRGNKSASEEPGKMVIDTAASLLLKGMEPNVSFCRNFHEIHVIFRPPPTNGRKTSDRRSRKCSILTPNRSRRSICRRMKRITRLVLRLYYAVGSQSQGFEFWNLLWLRLFLLSFFSFVDWFDGFLSPPLQTRISQSAARCVSR